MGATSRVREMLDDRGVCYKELAKIIELPTATLYNKVYRNTFKYDEVEKIAEALDYKIIFMDTRHYD